MKQKLFLLLLFAGIAIHAQAPPGIFPSCDPDNDGFTEFILSDIDPIVLAGQDPSLFTVFYYETQAQADVGTTPLSSPYTNIVAFDQVIYARIEENGTSNFTINAQDIRAVSTPVTNFSSIALCDDDFYLPANQSPQQIFDLTWFETQITSETGNTFSYYLSSSDASLGVNSLSDQGFDVTSFQNTVNPQDIYVRVEDPVSGCFTVQLAALSVLPNPTPLTPTNLAMLFPNGESMQSCENDGNGPGTFQEGYALFDLTAFEDDIIGGEANVVATYHLAEADAQTDTNAIANVTMFYNIVAYDQIVWVRVENINTGCYTLTNFNIHVPLPIVTLMTTADTLCVDENGIPLQNIPSPILTASATDLNGGASASDYTYQWEFEGTVIPGAVGQTLTVSQAGMYTVTAIGPTDIQCQNAATQTIAISSGPTNYSVSVISNPCDANQIIEATASGGLGTYVFSLDGGNTQANGVFENVSYGSHTVTIFDIAGCVANTIDIIVLECELPLDNFMIESISETCVDVNNGAIIITASEVHDYEVSLSLNGNDIALDPNDFTENFSILNLVAGTYYLCITATDVNVTQCFDVYVEAVENLAAFSGRIGNTYTLSLSGSKYYEIIMNGETEIVTTNSASETVTYVKELSSSITEVVVKTDKGCQGVYEERVFLEESILTIYPNPASSIIYVNSNTTMQSVSVYDMAGKIVMNVNNNIESLDISGLGNGLYFIQVTTAEKVLTSKFIKQ